MPNETSADATPGSAATAFSTVFAHAAQSMPSTRNRRVPVRRGPRPAASGAIGSSIGFTASTIEALGDINYRGSCQSLALRRMTGSAQVT